VRAAYYVPGGKAESAPFKAVALPGIADHFEAAQHLLRDVRREGRRQQPALVAQVRMAPIPTLRILRPGPSAGRGSARRFLCRFVRRMMATADR